MLLFIPIHTKDSRKKLLYDIKESLKPLDHICVDRDGRHMNKKAVSDIVLALLLIGALAFSVQRVEAEPTTITVPEDYLTIKEAVNGASSGDTIVVSRGHYAEGQVNVTKPLRSIAHGKVIVDGLHTAKSVFCVRSDKVVIEGFIVKNAREAGIYLSSADNCRIEQNTVTNNYWGISMADSSLNIIRGNKALNNRLGISVFFSECGDFVGRNIFEGNVVENNSGGDRVHGVRLQYH